MGDLLAGDEAAQLSVENYVDFPLAAGSGGEPRLSHLDKFGEALWSSRTVGIPP